MASLFSDEEIEKYCIDVFKGKINPKKLSDSLHEKVAEALEAAVIKGFGKTQDELKKGTKEYNLLDKLVQDVYMFAGAKQFQVVLRLTAIKQAKKSNTLETYLPEAKSIFKKYYENYLTAEIDSAEWQAKAGVAWIDFEKWNDEPAD